MTFAGNVFGAGRSLLSALCSPGGGQWYWSLRPTAQGKAFSDEHKTEWLEDLRTTLQMFLGGDDDCSQVNNTLLIGYRDFLVNVGTKFAQKCGHCVKTAMLLRVSTSVFEGGLKEPLHSPSVLNLLYTLVYSL